MLLQHDVETSFGPVLHQEVPWRFGGGQQSRKQKQWLDHPKCERKVPLNRFDGAEERGHGISDRYPDTRNAHEQATGTVQHVHRGR
jgi:hypothetical protein